MRNTTAFASLVGLGSFMASILAQSPAVPLFSNNRWILDANGLRVKLRCVNWAGHMETNIPDSLHKQSIDYIAGWIAQEGFNCVRLAYSVDMALDHDLGVQHSFRAGAASAGVDEGAVMNLYNAAVEKNPFLANATVIEVFAAVQTSLWHYGVMTVLDNHVSKAKWCCNLDDGNGWWSDAPGYLAVNSQYFNTQDRLKGLQAMATWSKGRPGVVGMSL